MTFTHRHNREGDVLFIEPRQPRHPAPPRTGPYVAISFDEDTQQWGVHISTEQLDDEQGSAPSDGTPYLDVYLNDATLYSQER